MPHCRFRGAFTSQERDRIERVVVSVEARVHAMPGPTRYHLAQPVWLVMRATPTTGAVYVGVRFRDGKVVRAASIDALATGIEALGRLRPPSQPPAGG